MTKKLSDSEIAEELKKIPKWTYTQAKLRREIKFSNFVEAFSFMTAVAFEAEKMNHHPDWENVYNRVVINLNTHDANGITVKDFNLAEKIESLL